MLLKQNDSMVRRNQDGGILTLMTRVDLMEKVTLEHRLDLYKK